MNGMGKRKKLPTCNSNNTVNSIRKSNNIANRKTYMQKSRNKSTFKQI